MKCEKCGAQLMSPQGTILETCPFCGTNTKDIEQPQTEDYGKRLYDMIQRRGVGILQDKRALSNFLGDVLYDNIRLQRTMRLAVERDVASKLLELPAMEDEQKQKSAIIRETHLFAAKNNIASARAVEAVRTLALGLGISSDIANYVTASQLPPTGLARNVLTQETASDLKGRKHFDIPYGYTDIEKGIWGGFLSFLNLDSNTITEITIPESVVRISESAFEDKHSNNFDLENLFIPKSVTRIGAQAFSGVKVKSVIIAGNIERIGDGVFSNCSNLQEVFFTGNVKNIGMSAFMLCPKLRIATLPEGLVNIEEGAFAHCKQLQKLVLPDGVQSIGVGAFMACNHLKKIVIPDSVTNISEQAFDKCENITVFCSKSSFANIYCKENNIPVNTYLAEHSLDSSEFESVIQDALLETDKYLVEAPQIIEQIILQSPSGSLQISFMMDRFYKEGLVDKMDLFQSVDWLKETAGKGHHITLTNIGCCYLHGRELEKDFTKAMIWIRRAAEAGDAVAQCLLADCYADVNNIADIPSQAFYWYRNSAEQGFVEAQIKLAYCYLLGDGVDVDEAQSVFWFQKAADQGDADAQYELGLAYLEGIGVSDNPKQAFSWFSKAAEQGMPLAQYTLGKCHKDGVGTVEDISLAAKWFEESARRGNGNALLELAFCFIDGKGVNQDLLRGFQFIKMLDDDGDTMMPVNQVFGTVYPQLINMYNDYLKRRMSMEPKNQIIRLKNELAEENVKLSSLQGLFNKSKRNECETRIDEINSQLLELKKSLGEEEENPKWQIDDYEFGKQVSNQISARMR